MQYCVMTTLKSMFGITNGDEISYKPRLHIEPHTVPKYTLEYAAVKKENPVSSSSFASKHRLPLSGTIDLMSLSHEHFRHKNYIAVVAEQFTQ